MKTNNINNGFSSIEVLVTLFVLAIFAISFSYILNFQQLKVSKIKQIERNKKQIETCFDDFTEFFKHNINLDCDGPKDSVYLYAPDNQEFNIVIQPLSGLIDINFLPLEFYSKQYFNSLLIENTDYSFIENFRKERKLITSYDDVKDFFPRETFFSNVSLYNLININTAESTSLYNYCNLKNCTTDIVSKRQLIDVHNQFMHDDTEASLYYGLDYDILKPYITVEAPININFANKAFISSLLSLEQFNLVNNQQKLSYLFDLIDEGTINKEQICNILDISNNDILYYYIGCITYFWKIKISLNKTCCEYILFRNENKFYLLKKQWQ